MTFLLNYRPFKKSRDVIDFPSDSPFWFFTFRCLAFFALALKIDDEKCRTATNVAVMSSGKVTLHFFSLMQMITGKVESNPKLNNEREQPCVKFQLFKDHKNGHQTTIISTTVVKTFHYFAYHSRAESITSWWVQGCYILIEWLLCGCLRMPHSFAPLTYGEIPFEKF